MRKLSVYLFALLAVAVTMTSCNKDEDPLGPPTLNFIGGAGYVDTDASIAVNTIFKIGIAASANAESGKKLTTLRITRTMDNTTFLDETIDINETTYNADFEFNAQEADKVEVIAFTLTDKDGAVAEKSLTITYEPSGMTVAKTAGISIGSFNDNYGSFYSTSSNQTYNITDAGANQSKIDFLFYKGATNGPTIASPADIQANAVYDITGWTTKNATLFMETSIDAAAFDAIESEYTFPTFENTTSDIMGIVNNQVIMFQTVDNKMGLIKISSINSRGDYAVIDVIVTQ